QYRDVHKRPYLRSDNECALRARQQPSCLSSHLFDSIIPTNLFGGLCGPDQNTFENMVEEESP
ncbi:MAG TPA: hypothetical protein VES92_10095, partial [Nitrospiraceae bacterium]|nr:hypothetical protein [Nitrospiraceae bacterium]